MNLSESLVAWSPRFDSRNANAGHVKVGPLPGKRDRDWSAGYAMTGGGAYLSHQDAKSWEAVARTFITFVSLVVRDGVDPEEAHREFSKIDEYRFMVSPEIGDEGPDTFYAALTSKGNG